MFDHLDIHVSDLAASRAFYHEALGLPTSEGEYIEWGNFGIEAVSDDHPLTRNLHVAFGAASRDEVDAWWNRMTEAGYRSDGDPGLRPQYNETYYGGFILDPDDNSVEAVHHERSRTRGIDHVWFRTRDLAATKRFYETIAPAVGIRLGLDERERIGFTDGDGSFTFVSGQEPTEHVHLAFGVDGWDAVVEFHRLATDAGFRDNGAPGERPQYHPGYFGAFVFDPDSNNVEAVFHARSRPST
ncbi:MAG TPA: VOC family protein [Gaiellaceae bacterium]|nr:VOC family protein [Gaiellaceae bacterium]